MPDPAKGLYAPRFVDLIFGLMGIGSAVLLINSNVRLPLPFETTANDWNGVVAFACVALIALSACFYHRIDRRGWDDYLGPVVTQSALIAMVTVILSGALLDFFIGPAFGMALPELHTQSTIPIACVGWSIGYGFLRWKGTNT